MYSYGSIQIKRLLGGATPIAALLDAGLKSQPSRLRTLLPSPESAPLRQVLLDLGTARTITLDLDGTDSLIDPRVADEIVLVLRNHWGPHWFCLCHSYRRVSRWRHAAYRMRQPLFLWEHEGVDAQCLLLGVPLQAREQAICEVLLRVDGASVFELAQHPLIGLQEQAVHNQDLFNALRERGPQDGYVLVPPIGVHQTLQQMLRRRYIIEPSPDYYSIPRPPMQAIKVSRWKSPL